MLLEASMFLQQLGSALIAAAADEATSPTLSFWKDISEIFKNVFTGLAIVGGIVAWVKWLQERHNRAVDVLAELEKKFTQRDLSEACSLVESDADYQTIAPILGRCVLDAAASKKDMPVLPGSQSESRVRSWGFLWRCFAPTNVLSSKAVPPELCLAEKHDGLDALLRFYVYLRGVQKARQVSDSALRACYRYWLTFYFHPQRNAFRAYVDWFFPTVSAWLRRDEEKAATWRARTFRRQRFFDPSEFGWDWIGSEKDKRMQLRRAIQSLQEKTRVIVVTGAGISAESGLPTFRGKEGYWRKWNPKRLATLEAFYRTPKIVWQFYYERRQQIRQSEPNAAHVAIVQLALGCTEFLLVTQNVDDLHDRAEYQRQQLSNDQIVHIHGKIFVSRCTNPNCDFERNDRNAGNAEAELPRCPRCNWNLRPGVVWFDEDNDPNDEERIEKFLTKPCDVVLVIGTTATFDYIRRWVLTAAVQGAWFIEINPDKTPLSRFAHHVMHRRAARVLPQLVNEAVELGPRSFG
jgi:NAD-dependent deacetylase